MAAEPISTEYFINPSHQSVFVCIPLSLLGNGSVKNVTAATSTYTTTIRIVGRVVFYAIRVASKEN
jgi:hypothetical protein